jgi:hypothetical protein
MSHQPQIEPAHLTVRDACAFSAYSRSRLYEAIGRGEIAAVKEGSRTLIVFESLKKQIASRKPAVIGVGNEKYSQMRKLAGNTRRRQKRNKRKIAK